MKVRPRKLASFVTASLYGLAVLPLIVLSIAAGSLLLKSREVILQSSLSALVSSLSQQTQMAIEPAVRILDSLRAEIATAKDEAETLRFLDATRSSRPDIEAIALLDAQGRILALSPSDERRLGDDLSGQPGFAQARASGKMTFSPSFPSPIDRQITVACFMPFGNKTGLVLIDLADLSKSVDQVRLSPKDEAAVVDETGRFIAHSDIRNVQERRFAPAVLEGGLRSIRIRGETEFAMARVIPGLGWRALYFRDAADSRNLFRGIFASLGLIALATMILAFILAHTIRNLVTRPFDAIFEQLEGFGEGDYGKRLDGEFPVEVAAIAGAFNRMAEKVERREAELQKSEGLYRSLFFGGEVPSLLIGIRGGKIVDANDAAVAYYGWSREELLARAVADIDPLPREEVRKIIAIITEKGNLRFSTSHLVKDGSKRDVEIFGTSLGIDGEEFIYLLVFDITDRVRAEAQVQRDLELKTVLLKEIHHRVKNNLQIVASLFYLQAAAVTEPGIRGILTTSQDRIQSLALAHELIYRSADLGAIDMEVYAEELIASLLENHAVRDLDLSFDFDAIALPLDRALNCGLLMNEVVTNALMHGMEGDARSLKLSMRREKGPEGAGMLVLEVADEGPGLPEGFSCEDSDSLGLSLSRSLADQLKGSIEWISPRPDHANDSCRGVLVRLRFPE